VRWLLVAVAAIVGFAACFFVSVVVGFNETVRAECDGPCFDLWDEVLYISLGVGVLGALLSGYATHRGLESRPTTRSRSLNETRVSLCAWRSAA
jgi:hypothetical protein